MHILIDNIFGILIEMYNIISMIYFFDDVLAYT